jgi:hypothetical protein
MVMSESTIANTLVAAHADRVRELARLYGLLERAADAAGTGSAAARRAHHELSQRIADWEVADSQAERRDLVALAGEEREAVRDVLGRAIVHAEREAEGWPPGSEERAVGPALRHMQAALPANLARADLVRVRRSAARLEALERLGGPPFILANEARLLLRTLESATGPVVRSEVQFDPDNHFRGTLAWALMASVIYEPGAAGAADLGLGKSTALPAMLGAAGLDPDELRRSWIQSAAATHPFACYPLVPRGRFCTARPDGAVSSDLDSTGPIGWAAGPEVEVLAQDLAALGRKQPTFAAELVAASARVASAARGGQAVIGFIEYVSADAEGARKWLIAEES